jgi:undecaprenyl-diphosphatase
MSLIEAIFLAIVQGTTEFFPISSSGHLVVISKILNIQEGKLSFEAILHLATGLAVLVFFAKDWKELFISSFNGNGKSRKFLLIVSIGSLPALAVGFLFGDFIEKKFGDPLIIAIALITISVIMLLSERYFSKGNKTVQGFKESIFVGILQVLAFIPGISRSAITIMGGMFLGQKRESATKFSLMLSTPIVMGAGVYSFTKVVPLLTLDMLVNYIVGFIASFFVGLFSIEFLLDYLKRSPLKLFAYYRFILGTLIIVYFYLL